MSYRILVAFDGSENSFRAADLAFHAFQHIPDCEIELITVFTFTEAEARFLGVLPENFNKSIKEKAEILCAMVRRKINHRDIPFKLVVLDGPPADQIINYANEEEFNHIIIGSSGWGKVKRLLMGSVSKKVVEYSHCTVTVVK